MPWCEPCAKYWAPSAMSSDGTCPSCGRPIDSATINGRVTSKDLDLKALASADGEIEKAPWHFKLLVGLLVIYLSWRFIQLFS